MSRVTFSSCGMRWYLSCNLPKLCSRKTHASHQVWSPDLTRQIEKHWWKQDAFQAISGIAMFHQKRGKDMGIWLGQPYCFLDEAGDMLARACSQTSSTSSMGPHYQLYGLRIPRRLKHSGRHGCSSQLSCYWHRLWDYLYRYITISVFAPDFPEFR